MRYSYAAVGALTLWLWAGPASAARYTDEAKIKSLTIMQDGSLRVTLKYQECPKPIVIRKGLYASRSLSLLMQAMLQSRTVRITSDSTATACNIAAIELLTTSPIVVLP